MRGLRHLLILPLGATLLIGSLSGSIASMAKVGDTCAKVGATRTSNSKQLICAKSGKKLIWSLKTINKVATPTPSPTASVTSQIVRYSATDKKTINLLEADEACSNPKNANFVIEAKVGSEWLPVSLIESGWKISPDCSAPSLGARNSLAWAKVFMDPGTNYRWIFSGEINMEFRDSQGRGISKINVLPEKIVPFVAPIPIELPVAQGAITFSNILSHMPELAQVAFDDVHRTIESNSRPQEISSTIWVGPNTTMIGSDSAASRFTDIQKLWSGFAQPKAFGAFFYSTEDEPAAEEAFAKWKKDANIAGGPEPSILANDCKQESGIPGQYEGPLIDCRNANGGVIDIYGNAMGLFGVPTNPGDRADPYRAGALENHEYTHMVQTAQFVGNGRQPGQVLQSKSPCWLQEGMAHFVGKSSASKNLSDYLRQRNGEALARTNGNGDLPPRDLSGISAYISLETLPGCGRTYSWGYATGMLIVEALSAIGGVQSTMALYTEEAHGYTFPEAFQRVYGISWGEAQPILVQVVLNDYLQANMYQSN